MFFFSSRLLTLADIYRFLISSEVLVEKDWLINFADLTSVTSNIPEKQLIVYEYRFLSVGIVKCHPYPYVLGGSSAGCLLHPHKLVAWRSCEVELLKKNRKKRFFNPPSGVIMPFSYHSFRLDNTFSYSGRVGL